MPFSLHALAVLAACLLWALDNNLTARISLADPFAIAMWKGLVAGAVNRTRARAGTIDAWKSRGPRRSRWGHRL